MSDSTWEDYSAAADAGAEATDAAAEVEAAPVVDQYLADAGGVDVDQGNAAVSWGDWNAETAADASDYADSEVAYAQQLYAEGYTEAGDAALARADASYDVADSHDATAGDYYQTAAGEYGSAADNYSASADAGYDTSSYDSGAADTSGYDAGAASSYDAGAASYDAGAADTSSYDAGGADAAE